MTTRGIRGATSAGSNTTTDIVDATRELLLAIMEANPSLNSEDVGSAIFSVTADLNAAFPARAARELGWLAVPLLCTKEIPVPGDLTRAIRILIQWNTELVQHEIQHVYLRDAVGLRPDIALDKNVLKEASVNA